MAKKGFWATEVDENVAQQVANIIGEGSAHGMALAELRKRREAGEDVLLMKNESAIIVVNRSAITNVAAMPTPKPQPRADQ